MSIFFLEFISTTTTHLKYETFVGKSFHKVTEGEMIRLLIFIILINLF